MNDTDHRSNEVPATVRRRRVIGFGAGLGVAVLAGCAGSPVPGGSPTDEAGSTADGVAATEGDRGTVETDHGTFRLLISDQPVAIDEFDSLEVAFDRARVFGGPRGQPDADTPTATATASPTESTSTTETTDTDTETAGAEEESGEGQRGFSVLDLGGATVDLTQVVGAAAMGVFEGPLPEGRYTKIELYTAAVEGVVAREAVDVKIPSGKLQITKPFEVVADETLSFVFDITVVRKGQGGYNLLPVISESGVAGRDVDVNEVAEGDPAGNSSANPAGNPSGNGTGPPDGQ